MGTCLPAVSAEIEQREGDWTVNGAETIRGKHIRVNGNLILPQHSTLTLEDCTLEILGDYSRQHSVEWKGGTLVTKRSKIGGFVNDRATAIHTVFHLYEGIWEATDTTVSYSYGISFHWQQGKGVLRGTRLKAGPRPDAIILSGEADVDLVDSDFPIGLGVYVNQGGKASLNLQPNQTLTAVYDRESLLPGVRWRLALTNTRVERWFLFVRQIGDWQPPAEITLTASQDLIVSLLGHNLKGAMTLSRGLEQPLVVGNVTLKTATGNRAGISMYGLYFSGGETDVRIAGESHICELMHGGGKIKIAGTPGKNQISVGCTTLELNGDAELDVQNVHLGRPLTWQPENNIGEANVKGNAKLLGRNISINNVRFRTEDNGQVDLQGIDKRGTIQSQQQGGSIRIRESLDSGATSALPKVWIYTDLSDKTVRGLEQDRPVNDPDDISAMAGYLLMCNQFDTKGIVVASTHRREHRHSPDQAAWANRYFGDAYRAEVQSLNDRIGGYPQDISFMQSCIKKSGTRYDAAKTYDSLVDYSTVQALLDTAGTEPEGETINVLCWGSLTEPAILVNHCLATDQTDVLKKLRFIAHWTDSSLHQGSPEHPERVANCREDAAACRYLKGLAAAGTITYYECGAIGQHGIVSGAPKGRKYYDQFKTSRLGRIFADGKFVYDGVDHSDSATYWTLLGNWGVSLADIAANGSNDPQVEQKNEATFRLTSKRIHDELLRRCSAAAGN